jgi:hypothetical protein
MDVLMLVLGVELERTELRAVDTVGCPLIVRVP